MSQKKYEDNYNYKYTLHYMYNNAAHNNNENYHVCKQIIHTYNSINIDDLSKFTFSLSLNGDGMKNWSFHDIYHIESNLDVLMDKIYNDHCAENKSYPVIEFCKYEESLYELSLKFAKKHHILNYCSDDMYQELYNETNEFTCLNGNVSWLDSGFELATMIASSPTISIFKNNIMIKNIIQ